MSEIQCRVRVRTKRANTLLDVWRIAPAPAFNPSRARSVARRSCSVIGHAATLVRPRSGSASREPQTLPSVGCPDPSKPAHHSEQSGRRRSAGRTDRHALQFGRRIASSPATGPGQETGQGTASPDHGEPSPVGRGAPPRRPPGEETQAGPRPGPGRPAHQAPH